jgi:hypothetical protein
MKNITWNVYSSMLGGFISMGHLSEKSAYEFIKNYHCKIEKKRMSVSSQMEN